MQEFADLTVQEITQIAINTGALVRRIEVLEYGAKAQKRLFSSLKARLKELEQQRDDERELQMGDDW